jgi:hypothetical protein
MARSDPLDIAPGRRKVSALRFAMEGRRTNQKLACSEKYRDTTGIGDAWHGQALTNGGHERWGWGRRRFGVPCLKGEKPATQVDHVRQILQHKQWID